MKKQIKRKKGQTLGEWIESIAGNDKDLYDLLHIVSVESYIEGSNAMEDAIRATLNNRSKKS